MKKLLAVLLCALLMFSGFTACSNSENKNGENEQNAGKESDAPSNAELILGKWEVTVNMTDMMNEVFGSDETMGGFINIPEFNMKFFFTFNENSIRLLEVDEDTLSESFDSLLASVKEGMYSYFEAAIQENQLEMTVEEMLSLSGVDFDALVEEMSNAAIEAMDFENLSFECYYELDGNKFYSYDTVGERNDEEYIEIEFPDENTLKFTNVSSEDSDNIFEMMTELKRVSE